MTTPFTPEAAVAAIEAAQPDVWFFRWNGEVIPWGAVPLQVDGRIGHRDFHLRFRHDEATLSVWPEDPYATEPETTATISNLTGWEHATDFATVEQALDTFTRLLAAQKPVTPENPTAVQMIAARVAARIEELSHA